MLQERSRSASWARQFATSHHEDDVVRIASEYLATWLPSDLEVLPPECRSVVVRNVDDLAQAAVTFTQCELHVEPDTRAAEILGSLTDVFIAAQARVRQLRSSRFDPAAP